MFWTLLEIICVQYNYMEMGRVWWWLRFFSFFLLILFLVLPDRTGVVPKHNVLRYAQVEQSRLLNKVEYVDYCLYIMYTVHICIVYYFQNNVC